MTQELRDKWEEIAEKTFSVVYSSQWRRTKRVIDETFNDSEYEEINERSASEQEIAENEAQRTGLAEILAGAITALYRREPATVQRQVQPLFDDMAAGVVESTAAELGRSPRNPDDLDRLIARLATEQAKRFGEQFSENSYRHTYELIQQFLDTPGMTRKELNQRIARRWAGSRPKTAAATETTRLVADMRMQSFNDMGATHYTIQTRNDDRVRPSHQEAANRSKQEPIPVTGGNPDLIPPLFDEPNCRCTINAVLD